ncbi:hypothetical protein G6F50_016481 [Rhizopus delemar]|uniref:Uncharacterized protein n=1 Tax=Rhizopus delemar TaxID=936053 RepID=A0A9P6XT51_9FUNG|nr:hypothetical protein G6F50_016481 [Rhizopus delemar]
MSSAGRRTTSGWPAAAACCSGCRKASASSRPRWPGVVVRGWPAVALSLEPGAAGTAGGGRRRAGLSGDLRVGVGGRRAGRGVGHQCARPGADWRRRPERAPVWGARWPAQPGIPRAHPGDVRRRPPGGGNASRRGGVRSGTGAAIGAARAPGDRTGRGAPQRAGARPDP